MVSGGTVVAWAAGATAVNAVAAAAAAPMPMIRRCNLLTIDLPCLRVSVYALCGRPC